MFSVAGEEAGAIGGGGRRRVTLREDPSGADSAAEKLFGAAIEHKVGEAAGVDRGRLWGIVQQGSADTDLDFFPFSLLARDDV